MPLLSTKEVREQTGTHSPRILPVSTAMQGSLDLAKNIPSPLRKEDAQEETFLQEVEGLREDLEKVFIESKNTESLMQGNIKTLEASVSTGNKSAEAVLSYLKNSENRADTIDKFLSRKSITREEAGDLINELEGFSSAVSDLDINVDVSLSQLVTTYKELVADTRLSKDHRKELLTSVTNFIDNSDIQSESLEELKKVNITQTSLEGAELSKIVSLLDSLNNDVDGTINRSLKDMSSSLDQSVLNQDELAETLDQEVESLGKTLKQGFVEKATSFSQGTGGQMASGAMSLAFNALGLDYLNMMGVPEMLGGRLPGMFGGGGGRRGGILSTVGGMFGRGRRGGRRGGGTARGGRGGLLSRAGGMLTGGRRGRGGLLRKAGGLVGGRSRGVLGALGGLGALGALGGSFLGDDIEEEFIEPYEPMPRERAPRIPKRKRAPAIGKKVGRRFGTKTLAKLGGKSLLKKLPVVGLLAGLGFGASRALKGDVLGAMGEVGSGALSMIPGVGTLASLALDVGMAGGGLEKAFGGMKNFFGFGKKKE
jgi:hypothetical protein